MDHNLLPARRIATVAMLLVFGVACAWLAARSPAGVAGSADPGAVAVPIWLGLIPVLLALTLIRVSPPRLPAASVTCTDRGLVRRELVLLLSCAAFFPS